MESVRGDRVTQMSKIDPKDVDAYLAAVPEPTRSTLERVRKSIRSAAPQAQEVISYGIPTFKYKGRPLVYFAAFKKHCSLYPMGQTTWKDLKTELKAAGAEMTGKGTLQFPIDKPLPAAVIKKIVKMRMKENDAS
jgi:uncharacterized protein YdhG (YjbR/CyaY superfamily)